MAVWTIFQEDSQVGRNAERDFQGIPAKPSGPTVDVNRPQEIYLRRKEMKTCATLEHLLIFFVILLKGYSTQTKSG